MLRLLLSTPNGGIAMPAAIAILDPIEFQEQLDKQFIDHGYSKEDREGELVVDDATWKVAVYEAVKKKVARSREEIAKNSLTNGELYASIFPNAPGTSVKELPHLSDMDNELRKALMRKVWGLTQAKRSGFIQKRLGAEGTRLVLCRATSTRGLDDADVCFVTDDADLIMTESVLPQIESLVRKADDLRLHAEMVVDRRPELQARITGELGVGVRRVEASLPRPDDSSPTEPMA